MTPEQLARQAIDHRSDIFAFGTLLYEMLTGRKAFDGATREEIADAIRDRQPASLPTTVRPAAPGLPALIETCLHKDPAQRWQDASALARALQDVDAARRAGRWPWSLSGVTAASLAVIGLTGFVGWIAWSLNALRAPSPVEPLTLGTALPLAATLPPRT